MDLGTGRTDRTHTSPPSQEVRRAGRTARLVRYAELFFLFAGLGLFCFLIYKLDVGKVVDNLRLVGWGIVVLLLQEIFAYTANTAGWYAAFPGPRPVIPAFRLLGARIAGDAVNYVTPTANLGGEFIRARLLRDLAEPTVLAASVTVAKLSQTVGQLVFVAVGLLLVLEDIPLPAPVRRGLLVGLVILFAAVVALFVAQQRGIFAPLGRLAQRFALSPGLPEFTRHLERLDAEIARFHFDAGGAFLFSAGFFLLGWTLGIVEIYLILWFMDVPVDLYRAFTIEVLSVAIDSVLFFVPAKLGTQEAGKVLIFVTLGLDPAKGLSLGILRRVRELSWTLLGLLIVSRAQVGRPWRTGSNPGTLP